MKNLIIIILVCFLFSCQTQFKIGAESAPEVDVRKYKSFAKERTLFVVRSNPILNSPLTRERIENAINKELTSKFYQNDAQNAELVYSFQTHTQNKQETTTTNPMPAMGWGYYGMYNNPMFNRPQTTTRNYEEATLIIDFKDKKTGKIVWQGWVIGEFKYSKADFNNQISEAVREALSRFPTRVGK
ncbi:MAG: DUF4136 domain-containing protein [Bacteroidetes bacterium]|nr:MAG: DUF4136 domain-containing protein [Bacteroidota bacterium]TAG93271.1 MAG: DUF4136 domain-containing protein [Bacteroidota bacterium]